MCAVPDLQTLTTPDGSISYLHYQGENDRAPAVFLLHGTGFLPWLWHPIARELARGGDVIAPFLRPRPHDDPEDLGTNWLHLAEDVSFLARALNIAQPAIVGHSMGGVVGALACGASGLAASKLVLIEPIFMPEPLYQSKMSLAEHKMAANALKRTNYWPNQAAARAYCASRSLFDGWDKEVLDLYLKYGLRPGDSGGLVLTCPPRQEASLFIGSDRCNPWPFISRIAGPVLVVEGEDSPNRGFINYPSLARKFLRGAYCMVPGCGHLVPMEKPKETLTVIRNWL